MQTALKFIYILSLSFWIGSIFFFSFFAAPSIFKVLPRETAGNVVSDIFPKYYLVAYVSGGAAIITTVLLRVFYERGTGILFGIRLGALLIMLALAVYAGEVLRPKAVEARAEMRSLTETSPNYPASHEKFRKLHARSAIINSAVFILGIAILFADAYTNKE
jgi:putative copper export protein